MAAMANIDVISENRSEQSTLHTTNLNDLDFSNAILRPVVENTSSLIPEFNFNDLQNNLEQEHTIVEPIAKLGRPPKFNQYNTDESRTLMRIFRNYNVNQNAAAAILKVVSNSNFNSNNVAPSWHYLSKIEDKNIPKKVILNSRAILII